MTFTRRRLFSAFPLLSRLSAAELSKIKLGVTTDEIDEDALTAVKLLREFGLQYAEVRNVWGKYNTAQPVEKIQELRGIFDQHRIKTSILGTGFFKVPLPASAAELDNQWSLLASAMERAKVLGTDKIRVFGFTYKDGETPASSAYPRIYELVTEAARRAKRRGFRLALENVGSSYIWSSEQAAGILNAVREDNFGLTWDANNAGQTGEKPFPDGYRKLDVARIIHVHLRDYRKNVAGKYEWCAVGEGEMDNLGQIRALLEAGYQETFTLETHYKHPQGKAAATRTSLGALLKVIGKVYGLSHFFSPTVSTQPPSDASARQPVPVPDRS